MSKSNDLLREKFKILYLSGNYTLTQIAHDLGVVRTTVYMWKRQLFPKRTENDFKKRMFAKLYESGLFSDEEITKLLHMHPNSIQRFKRNHKEYRTGEKRHNIVKNSKLWSTLIRKSFQWLN